VALAIVLAGTVSASAATLGGASAHALGAATAATSRVPAVALEWAGTPSGSTWNVDSVLVRSEGAPFAAGDTVKLVVAPAAGSTARPCEVRTTPAAATAAVTFTASAFAACGALPFDRMGTAAVAVSGVQAAVAASTVGDVRGALTSYAGELRNSARTLVTGVETVAEGGVSYISRITVAVTRGATAADLVGERIDLALLTANGVVRTRVGGVVSGAADTAVRILSGASSPTIAIDPRAGRAKADWPRPGDVTALSALLVETQRLGATASAPPVTLGSGVVAAAPGSALEAISLDTRLAYDYTPEGNHRNELTFCHTFTVTNTSSAAVTWRLTFDTSLPPLWGMDPRASGALSSKWGLATVSYAASTHRWTIGGESHNAVLAPGEVASAGYCAGEVPEPPVDPSGYTAQVSLAAGGTNDHVQVQVSLRSERIWNEPWQLTVDLADYVCASSLAGKTVTFDRVEATRVAGSATKYVIRGTGGDTRYVSASHPRDFVFASYSPGGAGWAKPCH
jgi:hypothetical protein